MKYIKTNFQFLLTFQKFDDEYFEYEDDIDDYINGGLKEISEDDALDQSIEEDLATMQNSFLSLELKV